MASDSEEEEEDDDDVEAALKKEVDQIRTSTEKNLQRFQSMESGANNVVFIRTLNVGKILSLCNTALEVNMCLECSHVLLKILSSWDSVADGIILHRCIMYCWDLESSVADGIIIIEKVSFFGIGAFSLVRVSGIGIGASR